MLTMQMIRAAEETGRKKLRKVKRVFTIYDRMEFPEYEFEQFPMMLYHPEGLRTHEKSVDKDGALKKGPGQFLFVGVENETELAAMLEQGWHRHPGQAAAAEAERLSNATASSAIGAIGQTATLEAENKALKDLLLQQATTVRTMQDQLAELLAERRPRPTAQVA